MNPIDGNTNRPPTDDEALDLLVDGELDEARRRELLLRLEREPDGWRRCALAFLEAQSLRQEMRRMVRRPAAPPPRPRSVPGRRWLNGRAGIVLAVAASFLIALGLGTLLRDFAARSGPAGPEPIQLAGTEKGSRERTADPTGPLGPQPNASGPVQLVNLSMPGGPDGARHSIQLPACQRDSIDEAWLNSFPQAMPEKVQQALRRTGHQVRQSRQLLPLRMKDGRQLVLPVDQVDVHYVGNQPFQ